MKKILFNNRYGLETAVIERRKTMMRRIVKCPKMFRGVSDVELEFRKRLGAAFYYDCVVTDGDGRELGQLPLPYEVGEVVAVGQRYKDCWDIYQQRWEAKNDPSDWHTPDAILGDQVDTVKGWTNKMFTRADLMPWRVRMTDLWFEHLQDISDEDCLREGIVKTDCVAPYGFPVGNGKWKNYRTPQDAFAALIDRISGRGTWKDNPWVVAYTMDLQRADGFKEQETNK